jgi:hypothetical protein
MPDRSALVYVALLKGARNVENGTNSWYPIAATQITGNTFKLLGPFPEEGPWEFSVGALVRCNVVRLPTGEKRFIAFESV